MKRFLIPLVILVVAVLAVIGGAFWWGENSRPVSSDKTFVRFVVPRGRSAVQVGEALYEKKLIRSSLAFKFYIQLTGKAKSVQAGEFQLSPSMTLMEIVEAFSKGPLQLWVTIPEGLRKEEVVERYTSGLEMQEGGGTVFRKEFLEITKDQEGFLFPDTYLFPRDVTVLAVVKVMRENFDRKLEGLGRDAIQKSRFSLKELVILASIIERETKTPEERPVVAGILLNRLEIGMGLQADATVQYAVGSERCDMRVGSLDVRNGKCDWWSILTRDDIQVDSPYNTYKYRGLPPAPIANPGLSSLKAAVYPADTDFLYYIHDDDGKIHFAKTLPEHNQNVRMYLGK